MRENAGLSREEVAELLAISVATVANYETKGVNMNMFEFEKYILLTTTSKEDRAKKRELIQNFGKNLLNLIGSNQTKS